jgi:hypothetical protein
MKNVGKGGWYGTHGSTGDVWKIVVRKHKWGYQYKEVLEGNVEMEFEGTEHEIVLWIHIAQK